MLRAEIPRPRYQPDLLAIGTVTDAHQPIERGLWVTRPALESLSAAQHSMPIVTKGRGVERGIDLLEPMSAQNVASVCVTLTTLDTNLARILEPRAAAPHRRLRILRTLAEACVPVGASVSPWIPFINDGMEQVLEAAFEAGERRAL